MVFELLEVAQRGQGPFPAEAVEALKHHQVKLLFKFDTVGFAT